MHKRILVPMDDPAFVKASLPDAQSPSNADRVTEARKAETWISLSRVEYHGNQSPFQYTKVIQQILFQRSQTRSESIGSAPFPTAIQQALWVMYGCLQHALIRARLDLATQ